LVQEAITPKENRKFPVPFCFSNVNQFLKSPPHKLSKSLFDQVVVNHYLLMLEPSTAISYHN
jgi:hypothetical protein